MTGPAIATSSRLDRLVQEQQAYDQERASRCFAEETAAKIAIVRENQKDKADRRAEHRHDHLSEPVSNPDAWCRRDAASVANSVALEALRGSTATTYFTWFAGLVAILALLAALLSGDHARRSWQLDRDGRRGRVGVGGIVRTGSAVTFDVMNVGDVPVIVDRVCDVAGNAYARSIEALAHLSPGDVLSVSAMVVWPALTIDIRYREYGGAKRRTVAELRPGSSGWVLGGLRERK